MSAAVANATAPLFFLGLVTIFKNEAHIMNEFLQHYVAQGVQRFWLTDNGSEDCSTDVIRSFFSTSSVPYTLISRPTPGKLQSSAYREIFQEAKATTTWLLVVDTDEFFYTKRGSTIAAELRARESALGSILQICVPWRVFGTGGRLEQPRCVVDALVTRAHLWTEWVPLYFACKAQERRRNGRRCDFGTYHAHGNFIMGKCILHMPHALSIRAHLHMGRGTTLCDDAHTTTGRVSLSQPPCLKSACLDPLRSFKRCIRQVAHRRTPRVFFLNHYKFQSHAYMTTIKSVRGRISGNRHFDTLGEYYALINITGDRLDTVLRDQRLTTCHSASNVSLPVTCSAALPAAE